MALRLKMLIFCLVGMFPLTSSETFAGEPEAQLSEAERRDRASQWLIDGVREGFDNLAAQKNVNYSVLPRNKVGAACIAWLPKSDPLQSTRVEFWGAAWDYDSIESAKDAALRNCVDARDSFHSNGSDVCDCHVILNQDKFVLQPTDDLIDAALAWIEGLKIPDICPSDIDNNGSLIVAEYVRQSNDNQDCGSETPPEYANFQFIINSLPKSSGIEKLPKIYPNPPIVRKSDLERLNLRRPENNNEIRSGVSFYPEVGDDLFETWFTDLSLPDGWHYEFDIHRVPQEHASIVLDRLSELDGSGLYGTFRQTRRGDVDLPFFRDGDQFARYVRSYDLNDSETYSAFKYQLDPERSRHGLMRGEKSRRLWVEAAIPVDVQMIPVGSPSRGVIPIAIQTDRSLYLYNIQIVPTRGGGGAIQHFEGAVFDISGCEDTLGCVARATSALKAELINMFQQAPLSGTLVADHRPPNQIRFQRRFKRSEILTGFSGPYFELSTYTITIWPGPAEDFLGGAELYFLVKSGGVGVMRVPPTNRLFMHVDHSLQISVGEKGSYDEPSIIQYARYDDVVSSSIQKAVANATASLGGTMTPTGIGILSE